MKNLILLAALFALLLVCLCAPAASQSSSSVYNVRPDDEHFLRYNMVANQFDIVTVRYEVGEIALGGSGSWSRVYWNYISDNTTVEGSNASGSDYTLAAVLQSAPFQYGGEDSVQFYRMAGINNHNCDPDDSPGNGGHGDGSGGSGSWSAQDWWTTLPNAVMDRSEFILEIVLASSGDPVIQLDSILVDSNAADTVVPVSGNEYHTLFHTVAISGLTTDTTYIIRIRPKRNGPTPYGMIARQNGLWINKSYIHERSGYGLQRFNSTITDSIYSDYNDSALAWVDSVWNATGDIPSLWSINFSPDAYDTLKARYYDSVQIGGYWVLEVKTPPSPKRSPRVDNHLVKMASPTISMSVYPNPNPAGHSIVLDIKEIAYPTHLTVRLFDLLGHLIREEQTGVVDAGSTQLIQTVGLAPGSYLVVVGDSSGSFLAKEIVAISE